MLRRPDKYRGAYVYVDVPGVALQFGTLLYYPPGSGALVTAFYTSGACVMGVLPVADVVGFVSGFTTLRVASHWPDYPPTGRIDGGQLPAVLPLGYIRGANVLTFDATELLVVPGNVAVICNQTVANGLFGSLTIKEFLSAEELDNWNVSNAG